MIIILLYIHDNQHRHNGIGVTHAPDTRVVGDIIGRSAGRIYDNYSKAKRKGKKRKREEEDGRRRRKR